VTTSGGLWNYQLHEDPGSPIVKVPYPLKVGLIHLSHADAGLSSNLTIKSEDVGLTTAYGW
jgi:hypothetical protein